MTTPSENAFLLLKDLEETTSLSMQNNLAIPKEVADQVAYDSTRQIKARWQGGLLYFRKYDKFEAHKRDLKIWEKFNGSNQHELSREFGLSVQYIYYILKKVRESLPKDQPKV